MTYYVLAAVMGAIVGGLIVAVIRYKTVGTFHIDMSNPEDIKVSLDLDADLDELARHEVIHIAIDSKKTSPLMRN